MAKKGLLASAIATPREFAEAKAEVSPTQINHFFNHLMGEALTIIETMTTDEVQRKAAKSVMGGLIHNRSVEIQQWIIRQSESKLSGQGGTDPFPYDW